MPLSRPGSVYVLDDMPLTSVLQCNLMCLVYLLCCSLGRAADPTATEHVQLSTQIGQT